MSAGEVFSLLMGHIWNYVEEKLPTAANAYQSQKVFAFICVVAL